MKSVSLGTLNIFDALRFLSERSRSYYASSSASYCAMLEDSRATRIGPFRPKGHFGAAGASSHCLVENYKEFDGHYCCNGILFNHSSPLRRAQLVTKKIVSTSCRIVLGSKSRPGLGMTRILRDWGWAAEDIFPIWQMLQQQEPYDHVFSSGKSHTLKDFPVWTDSELELDWKEYAGVEEKCLSSLELLYRTTDPLKVLNKLDESVETQFEFLITSLVEAEPKNGKQGSA